MDFLLTCSHAQTISDFKFVYKVRDLKSFFRSLTDNLAHRYVHTCRGVHVTKITGSISVDWIY
jgi:hypothetical protein